MAKGTSQRRTSKTTRRTGEGTTKRAVPRQKGSAAVSQSAEHVAGVSLPARPAARAKAPEAKATPAASGTMQTGSTAQPVKAATHTTSVPPAAQRQAGAERRSRSGFVLAGIVGGLIVFAGMTALQWLVVEPVEENGAVSAQDERIAALASEIADLSESLGALEGGSGEIDLSGLEERLAALEESAADAQGGGDIDALRSELVAAGEAQEASSADILARVEAIEAELADNSAQEQVARAFAAAELKSAIDRGGPFAAELDAFSAVSPDDPAVEALAGAAEEGVPTRMQLVNQFPDVARAMIAAAVTGNSDGVLDRLMNSAQSIVTVRPTGDVEGSSVKAVVSRMEARVNDGDFDAAVGEWETLPDAAKAVSEGYVADLRARGQAETILNDALSAATDAATATTN
ncbi:mitofilin family membrane protein [Pararhizobium haloflavum]|uniref:mitofilin family membrane protein n=1 Tax=Pararhizobium haloflavum TaxID=2037914 RepID=UPI000C1A5260|nr:mitofilin family membrane protein [Pararhizobium haloflavum]